MDTCQRCGGALELASADQCTGLCPDCRDAVQRIEREGEMSERETVLEMLRRLWLRGGAAEELSEVLYDDGALAALLEVAFAVEDHLAYCGPGGQDVERTGGARKTRERVRAALAALLREVKR